MWSTWLWATSANTEDIGSPASQEYKPRERTPLFRSLSILSLTGLAVATPTLPNDFFSGVTDRKVPSLFHPDSTGHLCKLQLSGKAAKMA